MSSGHRLEIPSKFAQHMLGLPILHSIKTLQQRGPVDAFSGPGGTDETFPEIFWLAAVEHGKDKCSRPSL